MSLSYSITASVDDRILYDIVERYNIIDII